MRRQENILLYSVQPPKRRKTAGAHPVAQEEESNLSEKRSKKDRGGNQTVQSCHDKKNRKSGDETNQLLVQQYCQKFRAHPKYWSHVAQNSGSKFTKKYCEQFVSAE